MAKNKHKIPDNHSKQWGSKMEAAHMAEKTRAQSWRQGGGRMKAPGMESTVQERIALATVLTCWWQTSFYTPCWGRTQMTLGTSHSKRMKPSRISRREGLVY